MKTGTKVQAILLSAVTMDRTRNVRDDAAYVDPNLKHQLAIDGQLEPGIFERIDGKIFPLKGHRRTTLLLELQQEGAINPKTGKVFDTVDGIIHENLTERERVTLLLDHGQRRGLDGAELQKAFDRGFAALYTQSDLAGMLHGVLMQYHTPKRAIGNTPAEILDAHKGVVDCARKAYDAPEVLHDAWMAKLRNQQAWPIKSELVELSKLHTKEAKENPLYTRKNPGPLFLAAWAEYTAKQNAAMDEGKTRSKSQASMNRTQIEDISKSAESLIIKKLCRIILRQDSQEQLPLLDHICVEIEKGLPEELKNRLYAILVPTPPTVEVTPAETTPAA